MHKHFSDWYRIAGLEPNAEWLPKRASAVENYSASAVEIVELTRFFFQLGEVSVASISEFQSAVQAADSSFKMIENDQELRVLAGAELVDIIERGNPNDQALAALALVCATVQNLRKPPCVPEIPQIAAQCLREFAVKRGTFLTGRAEVALKAIEDLGEPHNAFVGELRKTQAEVPILGEEVNMLWWLFAGYSRDENRPWTDFPPTATPLMVGKELADLTRVLPGSPAALAFIDRALKSGKPKQPAIIEIKEAINDADLEWRKKCAATAVPVNLQELMPVSIGIAQSVITPNANDWLPSFTSKTGIVRGAKLAPHLLSYQLYIERLLERAFEEAT